MRWQIEIDTMHLVEQRSTETCHSVPARKNAQDRLLSRSRARPSARSKSCPTPECWILAVTNRSSRCWPSAKIRTTKQGSSGSFRRIQASRSTWLWTWRHVHYSWISCHLTLRFIGTKLQLQSMFEKKLAWKLMYRSAHICTILEPDGPLSHHPSTMGQQAHYPLNQLKPPWL